MTSEDKVREIIAEELNAKVKDIKPTSGGYSHHMYEVTIDKEPFTAIIRFSNNSEKKERDLRKELYVMEKMKEAGVPVPKLHFFKRSKNKEEHDVMLLEKLKGIRLDTIWDSLSKEEKINITEKIGKLIKKIHSIKLEKFGFLEEGGKIEQEGDFKFKEGTDKIEYSARLRSFYKDCFRDLGKLASFRGIDDKIILEEIDLVLSNKKEIDYLGKPTLIHGDMVTGHIFVEKINGQYEITGLIDFEFAEPSDPNYDFIKLHRQGFFDDKELKNALEKGYGKINEKALIIYRISRDIAYAQVLLFSGDAAKGKEVLANSHKRIEEFNKK